MRVILYASCLIVGWNNVTQYTSTSTPLFCFTSTPDIFFSVGRKRKTLSPSAISQASKRKRVSFGVNLSPELFDKSLPPGTPVRKGSAPHSRISVGKQSVGCNMIQNI